MFQSTRLIVTVRDLWARLNTQLQATNQNIALHFLCLVGGFFIGNIFGTFLTALREVMHWDIFIIGFFVLICEFISFQTYRPRPREGAPSPTSGDGLMNDFDRTPSFFVWRPFNLVKLGILFGFFVDAFKVGS